MQLKILLFLILLYLSGLSQATSYSYKYLDNPNAGTDKYATYAYDINNNGQIVGFTNSLNGNQSFIYSNGVYTSVEVPNAKFGTTLLGINDSGQMTGLYVDELNPRVHSFLYDGNTFVTLDHPEAADVGFTAGTQAYSINNNGQVVGVYNDSSGVSHGFLYRGGSYFTLDVPNSMATFAEGINDSGIVVGFFYDENGHHGFSYDGITYTVIDNPNALAGSYSGTVISGINNMGIMTGYIPAIGPNSYGGDQNFIYDGNSFTIIDVPNSNFSQIFGINDSGHIVGSYESADMWGGFIASPILSPVPELSAWFLMLLGLSLMTALGKIKPLHFMPTKQFG
ncbi:MAG: hypothetical protein ABTQ25_14145 [Nitrosomonas ureae]